MVLSYLLLASFSSVFRKKICYRYKTTQAMITITWGISQWYFVTCAWIGNFQMYSFRLRNSRQPCLIALKCADLRVGSKGQLAKDVIFIHSHFVRFLRLYNMQFNAGHF